jgi:hypothetical protein
MTNVRDNLKEKLQKISVTKHREGERERERDRV